jgi:hypothetical protein
MSFKEAQCRFRIRTLSDEMQHRSRLTSLQHRMRPCTQHVSIAQDGLDYVAPLETGFTTGC